MQNTSNDLLARAGIAPGNGTTVVVAMSGGVDSSVAAALLHEHGYRVIGITLNLWDYHTSGGNVNFESGCCSIDTMADARAVCHRLGVPHYVLDLKEVFQRSVQQNFIAEYFAGRTPNPCVRCNTHIKWGALLQQAEAIGADLLATGHYARLTQNPGSRRWELRRAVDLNKDQSYALWGVRQQALSRTLFPLGELIKPEVRSLAHSLGLKTAHKKESQEICFIPDNDYRRFLRENAAAAGWQVGTGMFFDAAGNALGTHQGVPFYTIGQRKGLGLALGRPVFVTHIDAQTNAITVSDGQDLLQEEFTVTAVNWVSEVCPPDGRTVVCKIRYRDPGAPALLLDATERSVRVRFVSPQRAITPGQSAVFYDGDVVIGGGVIEAVVPIKHATQQFHTQANQS
ncbi:MAG: tRNA 2-thiouridine(34) synthase MnmA [candidate division KSB1 bacterium]|nr:tRNA 2-thiouridine(34) synthase MnmA [candidate division KSB1 bacterium]MDZ7274032.1 tRNA 2-thiouridine(34) synthase MnmA [candidate division KSB1 bacterium]MDZ7286405.1 tRNA 2-thiouridine(34) synthase MnmA [candidate division KSB1 bacterium]MDZ7296633.1 tRNA 2-thiouridine(34) synthase MnmA [candidate division KSB1 bacterium]MDZ7306855.1 tRNA 2-thiouridine(34) synthase MnmA [candidate division KSB1 bacterium]